MSALPRAAISHNFLRMPRLAIDIARLALFFLEMFPPHFKQLFQLH
jgi:hypothetical protein